MDGLNKASLFVIVVMFGMTSCSFIDFKRDASKLCPAYLEVVDLLNDMLLGRMNMYMSTFIMSENTSLTGTDLIAIVSYICANDATGLFNVNNALNECPDIQPLLMGAFEEDHLRICDGTTPKSWIISALENIDVNIRQCVIKTDINDVIEGCYQKTVGCSRDNLPGSYDKFVKTFEIMQRTTDELFQCLRVELPAALRQDNPCGVTLKDLMSILLVNFASKRQPYIGSTMNDIEFDVVKCTTTWKHFPTRATPITGTLFALRNE